MTDERVSRVTRVLGVVVGGGFLMLGAAELVAKLDDPLVLLFWLPTLWGGDALVLVGVFALPGRPAVALGCVILGAALGTLASLWTLILPLLALALIMFAIMRSQRGPVEREG